MAGGNLSSRAAIRTRDEFYSLGQSFNSMAEELEKTIETLRNFVTDAAHELLTPVAALRVNLELVRDESNPKKMLDEAELQTIRLQSIVESLLDLSTIEAENANFKPVSVGEIFSSLEETWEPLASQKGIQLQIRYPLGDISILGNQTQIVKALGNLLDNAVKFSGPAGSIQLGFEETSEMVQFYVKDQGIGIPEKEVEKVFQRFFRGRNTSEIPGSGLGLAIVKAIMNRHKGDVTLESTKEGTTVRLGFQRAD